MPKTNKNKISSDSINKLRKYCYSIAEESEDSSFELAHVKQVEDNIMTLAGERRLDKVTACLIALLHDIGRTKGGIYGKGHAKESARIAGPILKEFGISKKKRKIILEAISVHNKKKRIHDKYSELIKDADSMTRFNGLSAYAKDTHEFVRNQYALTGKCIMTHCPDNSVPKILKNLCLDIEDEINALKKEKIQGTNIHRIRVRIRQARSVIWYLKRFVSKNRRISLNILDDDLKSIFRDYEYSRKLYVLVKYIKKPDTPVRIIKFITKKRNDETKKLLKKAKSKHRKIIRDINHRIGDVLPKGLKIKYGSLHKIKQIYRAIRNADMDDVNSVHKLRLLCKKLIYLHDMGIIGFSQPDLIILLKKLHKDIGSINDRSENMMLLTKILKKQANPADLNEIQIKHDSIYDIGMSVDSIALNIFELNIRLV